MSKDYCTFFPEQWFKGFSREFVDISECCKEHDDTCSTRKFFLCLKSKIGEFHATYIGFGGSVGCWVKYTKLMIAKYRSKK